MRVIGTKTHGYIDYIVGLVLIAAPWLLGFSDNDTARWVTVGAGIFFIVYSLITRYELGLMPVISMRTHLLLDFLGGLALAVSPWLFNFADEIWQPHLFFGAFAMLASFITKQTPSSIAINK